MTIRRDHNNAYTVTTTLIKLSPNWPNPNFITTPFAIVTLPSPKLFKFIQSPPFIQIYQWPQNNPTVHNQSKANAAKPVKFCPQNNKTLPAKPVAPCCK